MIIRGDLAFDEKLVPEEYVWGSEKVSIEEYESRHFLSVINQGEKCLICSSQNVAGLGEYLSRYVFDMECIYEIETYLVPD